ncbi:hypothetical protein M885DRAFT_624294 [Pelagophyceae sp. CCMP2097]|nr:hypothetical protein M885DRAFT_624294 [Pelagophyceae sp. CCMP2097]
MGGAPSVHVSPPPKQAAARVSVYAKVGEHTALFHCFPTPNDETRLFIESHFQRVVLEEGAKCDALGELKGRRVSDGVAADCDVPVHLFQSFFFVELGELQLLRGDGKCVRRGDGAGSGASFEGLDVIGAAQLVLLSKADYDKLVKSADPGVQAWVTHLQHLTKFTVSDLLRRNELFQGVSDADVARVAFISHDVAFASGKDIAKGRDDGAAGAQGCYVVVRGTLRIVAGPEPQRRRSRLAVDHGGAAGAADADASEDDESDDSYEYSDESSDDFGSESEEGSPASGQSFAAHSRGEMREGDVFGEAALSSLESGCTEHRLATSATVQAMSDTLLARIDPEEMALVLEDMPVLAGRLKMVLQEHLLEGVSAHPIFASLDRDKLRLLVYTSDFQVFHPGTVLFSEGDVGDAFYILLHGKLALTAASNKPGREMQAERFQARDGCSKKLDSRREKAITNASGLEAHLDAHLTNRGEFFGELAIIRKAPRMATVACVRIRGSRFREFFLADAAVAAEFELKALHTRASVESVVSHPRTATLFRAVCADMCQVENFDAFAAITTFHRRLRANRARSLRRTRRASDFALVRSEDEPLLKTASSRLAQARRLNRLFFDPQTAGQGQVTISAKATMMLAKKLRDDGGDVGTETFQKAGKEIAENLKDPLRKFVQSQDYRAVLRDVGAYTTDSLHLAHTDFTPPSPREPALRLKREPSLRLKREPSERLLLTRKPSLRLERASSLRLKREPSLRMKRDSSAGLLAREPSLHQPSPRLPVRAAAYAAEEAPSPA